jgi:hypothetical protein
MKLAEIFKHWKIMLLMAGIFAFGMISGAVLAAGALGKTAIKILSLDGWPGRTVNEYKRDLRLTPEQVAKIRPTVEKFQPLMLGIRNETILKIGTVVKRMNEDISPVLTPEQTNRLALINKERENKFKKAFKLEAPDRK